MRHSSVFPLCVCAWLFAGQATAASLALSLADAVALTLQNNRTIKIDSARREADRFDLLAAKDKFAPRAVINGEQLRHHTPGYSYKSSTVAPSVGLLTPLGTRLSATLNASKNDTSDSVPVATQTLSLTVVQPLLKGAGIEVNSASVRTAEITDEVRLLDTQRLAASQVTLAILAYREVQRLLAQLKISQGSLERARSLVAVNDSLIGAGRMAAGDRLEAEAEVASQELGVEDARNQLDAARLALLSLLALEAATEVELTEPLVAVEASVEVDASLHAAMEYSPELRMSRLTGQVLRLDEAVAKNARLWDVSLLAGRMTGKADGAPPGTLGMPTSKLKDAYVGVQVSIPLGDLSARQAYTRARAEVQADRIRHEGLMQELERRVRDAVRNVQNKWRQLGIARRAVALSRKKLEFEGEKLKLGRSSNFVVLNFEADLRLAEANELNAIIGYLNALTALDELTGTVLDKWKITIKR